MSKEMLSSIKKMVERQNYTRIRVGVIEDPHIRREVREDGTLKNFDPLLVKTDRLEDSVYPDGLNIVNTTSGTVSIKWIDGDGVGVQLPQGFEVEVPAGTQVTAEQLATILEPVLMSSSGVWGGLNPSTGLIMVSGIEYVPPVGSVVVVGFIVGGRPVILGYILPNYMLLYNSENSYFEPLSPGELRFSSFGGSYIYLSNNPTNSQVDLDEQVSDIVLQHVLGGKLSWSSIRGDRSGTFSVTHPTGSAIQIDDFGNISLSQPLIPDYNNPNTVSLVIPVIELLRNGAINLISSLDVLLKAAGTVLIEAANQFRLQTKNIFVSAQEDSEITLNRSKILLGGTTELKATSDVKLTFQSGFTVDCYGGLNLKSKGSLSLIQEGEVTVASKGSFATIIGVGGEQFVGGIVTSHTVCPIGGFHFGAIGNTSRAGNIVSSVGVPIL